MTNFLQETIDAITDSGHTPEDITFIGSEKSGHSCTWQEFQSLADFEYDCGWGAAKVAQDLIVVFSDGTKMWRGEYDGSEWWEHQALFKPPAAVIPITTLVCPSERVGWVDLAEINPL